MVSLKPMNGVGVVGGFYFCIQDRPMACYLEGVSGGKEA